MLRRFIKNRFAIYALVLVAFLTANVADYLSYVAENEGWEAPQHLRYVVMPEGWAQANDPCATQGLTTSTAVTDTADVKMITGTTGQIIYVCGYDLRITGSSGFRARFQSGTGTTCQTGTVQLSGNYLAPTTNGSSEIKLERQTSTKSAFRTISGADLCMDLTAGTAGTGLTIDGFITYVRASARS